MKHVSVIVLFCLAGTLCSAEPAWTYQWKAGELYRFDYSRTLIVKQPDETGKTSERKTKFTGVLILEIRSLSNGTASALMRFDNPLLTLPAQRSYGSQADEITENAERSNTMANGMIAAIKAARWSVTLLPDGTVKIDSRVPEKFTEWTRELANAGRWRVRYAEILNQILENDAGLKVGAVDRDLFYVQRPSEEGGDAERLRPIRVSNGAPTGSPVLQQKFQRTYPSNAAPTYDIQGMAGTGVAKMTPGKVVTKEGSATLDTRLGMLDSLDESYTVPVSYTLGNETLQQEVSVHYRLLRIAPAIAPVE